MKIGAIDIGTNSMRLLVCDYLNNEFKNRKKYVNTTRIGKGVDSNGYISENAIKTNIDALVEYRKICDNEKCEKIFCIGTSALRDSKNKEEFIKLAKEKANIDVEIISGKDESEYGFIGVLSGYKEEQNLEEINNKDIKSDLEYIDDKDKKVKNMHDKKLDEYFLVIDIGGGSTEFIVGNFDGIKFSKSENIGAVRFSEKFIKEEITTNEKLNEMDKFIEETIKETIQNIKKHNIKKVIGIGGTISSVSAINQEMEVYSMDKIHNSEVKLFDIEKILQKLSQMTLNDKKKVKGLQEKRADIIVSGVKILEKSMKLIEKQSITVSEYDNLEGLICQKLKKMS